MGTQDELLAALAARGITVTQSTLSRDLKDLRVTRVPVAGRYRYLPADSSHPDSGLSEAVMERLRSVSALEVVSVDANETTIVIRTLPGRAQGLAHYLDGLEQEGILGTVAGDDTILVLPRSTRNTGKLRRRLTSLLGVE